MSHFPRALGLLLLILASCAPESPDSGPDPDRPPNFVLIFADDLGYGDLGAFGGWIHRTPHLDRMAREGMRFTSFYSTSGVCTPSRSSLMTGSYARRVSMDVNARPFGEGGRQVLFPVARKGLHPDEVTVAEVLQTRGYATMCIGKWHLGDQTPFLPTRQGFDAYFGIPYSNDMYWTQRGDPPLPLMRDETVVEAPVDQNTLTRRYAEEAVRFIEEHRDEPFFLYVPHAMPHNPTHASDAFRGQSANGRYGDAVEEIDWSVGQILDALARTGLDRHTLVLFTSDNGAAGRWGGSNSPLRGFKGSTLEGGMRVPMLVRWPEHIPAGATSDALSSTMDVLPTFASLAGAAVPDDRVLDGHDIRLLLAGETGAASPYEAFFYYLNDQLQAVRSGRWKLHLPLPDKFAVPWNDDDTIRSRAELYDLTADISENTNLADAHPEVVERLLHLADSARAELGERDRIGANQRPAGLVDDPTPRLLPGTQP